ncbi:DNA-3-methyladenine glycosylase I [Spiroplasma endosymbiont of Cantharis lateralis]|uniref:DNA-3-methyladenine glycosylase I n=1 Tax=Spiroplasma endosymbiont of Cantharis lateralis TaxID=3066277 RepID=UPI00313E9D02
MKKGNEVMKKRCQWANKNVLNEQYHDNEWAKPIYDDKLLFEMLILEINQAGLSWDIIVKKRANFRDAFDNWDYHKIALYDEKKKEELILNKGIVRNRLKINAAVNNAKAFIKIQENYESFSNFIWSFTKNKIINNSIEDEEITPSFSELSIKIGLELKQKGFSFLGKTTVYSFLQAIGIVNDHYNYCSFKN